ncbi:MAG: hypothetical protein EU532_13650 [Promethearchaeota archaeon]|nr:MAG: hypothetical protein EU532_13650 [Candidatus Lokiarchaeota archaeon]
MIDKEVDKSTLFYCINCGWKIMIGEIEHIGGCKEKITYCQECGEPIRKLLNYNFKNKYSDEILTICQLLYEKIGSFRGIEREFGKDGIEIDRRIIMKRLNEKFLREGKNFDEWVENYKKHQRNIHYKDSEVEEWKILYEQIGSFLEVANYLRKANKPAPDYSTIVKRLMEKFEKDGVNFQEWENAYKRENPSYFLPHYTLGDANKWKKIFEKKGSYRSVENLVSVSHHTIKKYIIQLAEQEGWDFNEWEDKYHKERFTYSNDDLEVWIELYEDLGSFLAVSNYLSQKTDQSPDSRTIKSRLKKEFNLRGWNFRQWIECNEKLGLYNNEDILNWKSLYEELGNFTAVSKYLNDQIGENPDPTTIKNKLYSLFQEKELDFQRWVNEYYNDNSERHYLIGKYIHFVLEYIFIDFTLDQNLKGFYEIMPNRLNGNLKSVDNVLFKSPFSIINIDYTTSNKRTVIIKKCKKGYQDFNRKLIIILLNRDSYKEFLIHDKIPFKDNVVIFSEKDFSSYIGYYGNFLENYNDAVETMKEAYHDDFFLNKLRKLAKEAKKNLNNLSEIYPISQENYELEASWWQLY